MYLAESKELDEFNSTLIQYLFILDKPVILIMRRQPQEVLLEKIEILNDILPSDSCIFIPSVCCYDWNTLAEDIGVYKNPKITHLITNPYDQALVRTVRARAYQYITINGC